HRAHRDAEAASLQHQRAGGEARRRPRLIGRIGNMTMRLAIAAGLALATLTAAVSAGAAEAEKPKSPGWTFDGVFGTFDRKQLQRGLKVYTTICAGCHGLRLISYRNLVDI